MNNPRVGQEFRHAMNPAAFQLSCSSSPGFGDGDGPRSLRPKSAATKNRGSQAKASQLRVQKWQQQFQKRQLNSLRKWRMRKIGSDELLRSDMSAICFVYINVAAKLLRRHFVRNGNRRFRI